MKRILFTADLHFGHEYILKYPQNKSFSDIREHDEWLADMWKGSVRNGDMIYLLGDLGLDNKDFRRIIGRLPGRKCLIAGNHDYSISDCSGLFHEIHQIHDTVIKSGRYNGIPRTMRLSLCHYPLLSWRHKAYGAVMLHGHCHGNMDEYNKASKDLRFDVGINGELAGRCGGFVDLDTIYQAAVEKTGGLDFHEYAERVYEDFEK